MSAIPILEARDLKVVRGGSVLVDVPELAIVEGEALSLIGPNGAGKTTLLHALSFLAKPSAGEILFRGRPVGASPQPPRIPAAARHGVPGAAAVRYHRHRQCNFRAQDPRH